MPLTKLVPDPPGIQNDKKVKVKKVKVGPIREIRSKMKPAEMVIHKLPFPRITQGLTAWKQALSEF